MGKFASSSIQCYLRGMDTRSCIRKDKTDTESVRINPPRNMSVAELAIYFGVSERKTRELIALRSFKVVRFGSRILVRVKDADQYLESLAS